MKIRQAMRYHFMDSFNGTSLFYMILMLIYAVALIPALLFSQVDFSTSGAETSAMIFIFVAGLNSFKPNFRMFLQNGVSRRTHMAGFHLNLLAICLFMALMDILFPLLFAGPLHMRGELFELYGVQAWHPLSILLRIALYLMLGELGMLVTCLYYRMSKPGKLLFSIGVPTLLIIVLPLVGALFPALRLFERLGQMVGWYLGYMGAATPLGAMVRCTMHLVLTGAIWVGCSWLLVRRATLKGA